MEQGAEEFRRAFGASIRWGDAVPPDPPWSIFAKMKRIWNEKKRTWNEKKRIWNEKKRIWNEKKILGWGICRGAA
ncbi:hypothetical protein P1J78_18790 [Psychromarinibacter sp. C21-152]|uniref:Uncharacterized protein n=1 Tax=Psychromarinibacter sediminicola TaxID=3033385 RepID=A0AAE3NY43_9RHOB|nr:hypothetical protein [Psychromarinibacter sediminicola]MDF0602792.1 hypothetical protein [Psychromarinibacter sediminicola]